jgi:hypothetical protein
MCYQSVFLVFQSVWIYDGVLKIFYSLIMGGYYDIHVYTSKLCITVVFFTKIIIIF